MKEKDIVLGLLAAVVLALLISPFASKLPDGLERVAIDKGFMKENEAKESSVPGILGVGIVFLSTYAIALLIRRRKS